MDGEAEQVDEEGDDNKTHSSGYEMGAELNQRHLGVAKLPPEVLDGVDTDESSDEQADQLDTGDESDAKASHEQP
jgi:hypothetical protein